MNDAIPVLSLVVALLAVFFGPLISLLINRRQIHLSRAVANKQIIAPMRQAWINRLREMIGKLCTEIFLYGHYPVASRNPQPTVKEILHLHEEIKLTLNPSEQSHKDLEIAISDMISAISNDPVSQEKTDKGPSKGATTHSANSQDGME